jgi:catechol 2,3-dioxygenase-like lactoylglutathione lyase family enzyme
MSTIKSANASTIGVECIIPILSVKSLPASLRFYVDLLGFKVDWEAGNMASVSRDGQAIMLCQGSQGHPGTWIWMGVEDIEPLFDDYSAKGVTIRRRPTNYEWAYEMCIEDPDGHVLRIGSEPKTDEPFA